MEQVNAIELSDADVYPDDAVLKKVLGRSFAAYEALLSLFDESGLEREWRYYRDGKAWLCKVGLKGKTVVWMSAWRGYMKATIYFPERLAEGLAGLGLEEETLDRLLAAKKVGKSLPCSFDIASKAVLKDFAKVMRYKLAVK